MNRFPVAKQEGGFRIGDLNSPWRSVLHLGRRQMVEQEVLPVEDDPGNLHLLVFGEGQGTAPDLSETGKGASCSISTGVPLPRNRVAACFPFASASLVALESGEVYNFPGPAGRCRVVRHHQHDEQSGPLAQAKARLLQPDNRKRRAGPATQVCPVSAAGR